MIYARCVPMDDHRIIAWYIYCLPLSRIVCVLLYLFVICHWTDRYTLHMGRCLVPLKGRQDVVAACPMACEIPLCVLRVVPGKER